MYTRGYGFPNQSYNQYGPSPYPVPPQNQPSHRYRPYIYSSQARYGFNTFPPNSASSYNHIPPLPYPAEERGIVEVAGCDQPMHRQVHQPAPIRSPQLQPSPPQRGFVPSCIVHGSRAEEMDVISREPPEKLAENCDEGKQFVSKCK